MVFAWLDPDRAVYPRDTLYGERGHPQERADSSPRRRWPPRRTTPIASALGALDIPFTTKVGVAAVEKGGPADGKLEPGDIIVSVNGNDVSGVSQVTDMIRPLPVGSKVDMTVRRGGKLQQVHAGHHLGRPTTRRPAPSGSRSRPPATRSRSRSSSSWTRTSAAPRPG